MTDRNQVDLCQLFLIDLGEELICPECNEKEFIAEVPVFCDGEVMEDSFDFSCKNCGIGADINVKDFVEHD